MSRLVRYSFDGDDVVIMDNGTWEEIGRIPSEDFYEHDDGTVPGWNEDWEVAD